MGRINGVNAGNGNPTAHRCLIRSMKFLVGYLVRKRDGFFDSIWRLFSKQDETFW